MEVQRLIGLAESALSAVDNVPQVVAAIEQYAEAFDEWFRSTDVDIEAMLQSAERDNILTLADKHAAVLKLAGKMRAGTLEDLKGLQKKGKGLMAYTDVFPRKISTSRTRKG